MVSEYSLILSNVSTTWCPGQDFSQCPLHLKLGAEAEASAGGRGSAGVGTQCFKTNLKRGVTVTTGCYYVNE